MASLSAAVKVIALISVFCGVGVGAVSSWVLHRSLQARINPTLKTANDLLYQVNLFFGGTTGLYDLDEVYRILISCSGVAVFAGFLQFLMSFWLLLASADGGEAKAKLWVFIEICLMAGIGGSFLCIFSNELDINVPVRIFLCVTGVDFILMIFFIWIVFTYAQRDPRQHQGRYGNPRGVFIISNDSPTSTGQSQSQSQISDISSTKKLKPILKT